MMALTWKIITGCFISIVVSLLIAVLPILASPAIENPQADPSALMVGLGQDIIIGAYIPDLTLIHGSVYLWRLDEANKPIAKLGVLHDDGMSGDKIAGDRVFSIRVNFQESNPGYVRLRITAAFKKMLKRVQSDIIAIHVWKSLTVANPENDLWATNQGHSISLCWSDPPEQGVTIVVYRSQTPSGPWQQVWRLPLGSDAPNCAVDGVDGTQTNLWYRADVLDSTDAIVQTYVSVEVPQDDPQSTASATTTPWNDPFISDEKMEDRDGMTLPQIRALLKDLGSFLKDPLLIPDQNGGQPIDFALALYSAAQNFQINPQVLLITVQKEWFLLKKNTPPAGSKWQKHITNCGSNPATFTIQGQLSCAAQTYHNAMVVLKGGGVTLGGWQTGVPKLTDAQYENPPILVTPATSATAALFNYNPLVGHYWNSSNPYAATSGFWDWWANEIFRNWAYALKWEQCGSCPETPEIRVDGISILMGVNGRGEDDSQSQAVHGVSAKLRPSSGFKLKYDFGFNTWDSYSNSGPGDCFGIGYWDSFSIGVTSSPYWQMGFLDPLDASDFAFLWGGLCYGDYGLEQRREEFCESHVVGDPTNPVYLNIVLDTASEPEADNAYPSWGGVTLREVVSDDPPDTKVGVGP